MEGGEGVKQERYPLAVPQLCPHCGWEGRSDKNTELRFGKLRGSSLKDFSVVEWRCPACKMWITEEDEEL